MVDTVNNILTKLIIDTDVRFTILFEQSAIFYEGLVIARTLASDF